MEKADAGAVGRKMTALDAVGLLMIAFYRAVGSIWFGGGCRFEPSCSVYGELAVQRFGLWKGGWLTLRRISKCHPGGAYGYDPVPESEVEFSSMRRER